VDTPGIHQARGLLNERMVRQALSAMPDADVILWLVDSEAGLDKAQREIARRLPRQRAVIIAVNKIDLGAKERLLPILAQLAALLPGCELIPISARTGENVDTLLSAIERLLPEGPRYYPGEEITDESERSLVAEIVREKIMLETEQEVPYAVAVTVDEFSERPRRRLIAIQATIHVERDSQKGILIGQGGQRLKSIGRAARLDAERLLGTKVYLELFVRVQPEWTRRAALLQEFGL
jgi:GTP-binding protein Era